MNTSTVALIVLFTGILVVFTVLILLILVIKGLSRLINIFSKDFKKQKNYVKRSLSQDKLSKNLDPQIIAAISAAVYTVFYSKNKKVKILEITPKIPQDMTWKTLGAIENTKPFIL